MFGTILPSCNCNREWRLVSTGGNATTCFGLVTISAEQHLLATDLVAVGMSNGIRHKALRSLAQ